MVIKSSGNTTNFSYIFTSYPSVFLHHSASAPGLHLPASDVVPLQAHRGVEQINWNLLDPTFNIHLG